LQSAICNLQSAPANPQSEIRNPQSDPTPNPQSEIRNPQSPATHPTHTRIFVGGHPPTDTSRVNLDPTPRLTGRWDPYRGGGTIVMIDPSTGKKYGEPDDDYGNDPLGQLYRRVEARLKREREARSRAEAGQ
jgi:hypothetical protein